MKKFLSLLLLLTSASGAQAELKVADVFTSHMVLQRDEPVPVWGWDDPGREVKVAFAGQNKRAKAGKGGKWMVTLDPLKTSAKGAVMTIKGSSEAKMEDILVGEVWIASGQSNMQWAVRSSNNPEEEAKNAKYPNIRLFQVPTHTAMKPQNDSLGGGWKPCTPENVPNFSAVAYYFGRHLHQELDVPIGLLQTAWGGTRSEAWTSPKALLCEPAAKDLLVEWKVKEMQYNEEAAMERYEKAKEAYEKRVAEIKAQNIERKKKGEAAIRMPRAPGKPVDPRLDRHHPSAIYHAMIAPIAPFQMKGAIWYQGESNQRRAEQYATIFPTMIKDWRNLWGEEFPFHFVQLANFYDPTPDAGTTAPWQELQWAQYLTDRNTPNTGMAIINDIGEAKDIHPKNKQDVGKRLALLALANQYGKKDIVSSGPLYRGMRKEGKGIRIYFDHAGKGLQSRDKKALQQFEIAGADRIWHLADAKVDKKDQVVVTAKGCPDPLAVRYAWNANAVGANLVNSAGLPASLFRTDRWKLRTDGITRPDQEASVGR